LADTIRAWERLILDKLLLNLTPESLGFNIDENTELRDDLTNTDPGYSVVYDNKNPLQELKHVLPIRFFEHADADFLHTGNVIGQEIEWKNEGAAQYLETYHKVMRELSFILHAVGGQPGRGTEFIGMRWINGTWRVRNVYMVAPGQMVYMVFYNKTTGQTGLDRVVAHAIPWRIARMILILESLVNPFVGVLLKRVAGDQGRATHTEFMFNDYGKQMKSEDLGMQIQHWFTRELQVPFRLRLFRQFVIACQRKLMPGAFTTVKRALNVVDAQAGHSTEVARDHYAIDVSEAHLLADDTVQKYIAASNWWWLVLFRGMEDMLTERELRHGAEAPRVTSDEGASLPIDHLALTPEFARALATELLRDGHLARNIADQVLLGLQGLVVSGSRRYPVPATSEQPPVRHETPGSPGPSQRPDTSGGLEPREQPDAPSGPGPSQRPHASGGLEPTERPEEPSRPEPFQRSDAPGVPIAVYRPQPLPRLLPTTDDLILLRLYCKNNTAFWSSDEQAQAFLHVIRRSSSLLIVLPTGGGKSFIFAGMQYQHAGVTVVVFPLRALMTDQINAATARDPKHPWRVWDESLNIKTGTVVTAIENIPTKNFLFWCQKMDASGELARIVIDECHLVPASESFRQVMTQLNSLVTTRVPIIALSATMPPSYEARLCDRLGAPTWGVIRTGTQNPLLHLRMGRYKNRAACVTALQKHVEHYLSQLEPHEGILIIVRTKYDAANVSQKLRIPQYHGDLSNEEKDRLSTDWIAGRFQVIVGTTALGTGVHHPSCRVVIHLGYPYGLMALAQEGGRTARGGLFGTSIVLYYGDPPNSKEEDLKGYTQMLAMIKAKDCMRVHASRFLDGEERIVSCASGYAECGRCVVAMRISMTRSAHDRLLSDVPDSHGKILRENDLLPDLIVIREPQPGELKSAGSLSIMGS
jgi:superfamily II DNA or RNA helicase